MVGRDEFVDEMVHYVRMELERQGDVEYCQEAIQIVDARNAIFRNVGIHVTDEQQAIYRLKELCIMDENMEFGVNVHKIRCIATSYFAD